MPKSKQPTDPAKTTRSVGHRPRKWKPPEPEYLDWRTVDLSQLAYPEDFPIKQELATFQEHLEELLRDEGKYVLIKGREIVGIFDRRDDAIGEAIDRFGSDPVLIKKIAAKEMMATMGGVIY